MVSKSMAVCRAELDREIFVRIGITGEGKAPNYWLTYDDDNGVEHSYGTYQGSKRAAGYDTPVAAEMYSASRVSIFDVRKTLQALRETKLV